MRKDKINTCITNQMLYLMFGFTSFNGPTQYTTVPSPLQNYNK